MLVKSRLLILFMTLIIFAQAHKRNKALKWGIAGTGKICHDFVNSMTILSSFDHEVVAVAARQNLTKAKEFAKRFSIPKAYAGYKNLAKNPDIDIVYIGNIHPQHFATAKIMLEFGKNVLLEKPLTMNRKQAKVLITLAKEKNVFFMEGLWSRFMPSYQFIQQEVKDGKLGRVVSVYAELGSIRTDKRFLVKELGGGAALDLGVYGIDIIQWVLQKEPKFIKATGVLNDEGVDTNVKIELDYGYNTSATILLSITTPLSNTVKIVGTKRSMEVPMFWYTTSLVDVYGNMHVWPLPTGAKYPFINTNRAGLAYEAEAVREHIFAGKNQIAVASHAISLSVADMIEEVRRQIGVEYITDYNINYISPNLAI